MTKVKFLDGKSGICGFEISGHSTLNCDDEEGKLLCSAISSAAYMAVNTVSEIVGDDFDELEVKDGFMKVKLLMPSRETRVILEGFKLHITSLSEDYKNKIQILTEV